MQNVLNLKQVSFNGNILNSVNSKDIYNYLQIKTEYSHWIKRTIKKYDFLNNEDYIIINVKNDVNPKNGGGRPEKEYIVTLDMEKELSMIANTKKGKQVRKYFIEIEKNKNNLILPQNYTEALEHLLITQKAKEKLQIKNKEYKEIISNSIHSANEYTITNIAKDIHITAKLLNKMLLESKIQFINNNVYCLYSRYASYGLTTLKEIKNNKLNKTFLTLRWTIKGKNFIMKNLEKIISKCTKETQKEYYKYIDKLIKIPNLRKNLKNNL